MKVSAIKICLVLAYFMFFLTSNIAAQMRDGNKLIHIDLGVSDVGFISKVGYSKLLTRNFLLGASGQFETSTSKTKYSNVGLNINFGLSIPFWRYKAYLVPNISVMGLYENGYVGNFETAWKFNYGGSVGLNLNFYVSPNILIGVFANQKIYGLTHFGSSSYDLGIKLMYSFF